MAVSKQRRSLFNYRRFADDKKVKALYTLVENEISEKENQWTKEYSKELERRKSELIKDVKKGVTRKQVQDKLHKLLKNGYEI
ncbi:MAG: hypothetical protein KIS69_01145 [Bacteroidetes bacterium]|mgnify:CR=1 FL=1|nr:hypothetical protein [Bacteroidota bacterium]MCB8931298.1 hypothetical protein [Bacteroidia bacterium]MCW5930262.1 hypothetical protein [Bacteroidota bacterium]